MQRARIRHPSVEHDPHDFECSVRLRDDILH
jgi:hypothetical protein